MPQATEELRQRWDGPCEDKAMGHLLNRGYRLDAGYCWHPPKGVTPTEEDFSAAEFLIQEWDFGWIIVQPANDEEA